MAKEKATLCPHCGKDINEKPKAGSKKTQIDVSKTLHGTRWKYPLNNGEYVIMEFDDGSKKVIRTAYDKNNNKLPYFNRGMGGTTNPDITWFDYESPTLRISSWSNYLPSGKHKTWHNNAESFSVSSNKMIGCIVIERMED